MARSIGLMRIRFRFSPDQFGPPKTRRDDSGRFNPASSAARTAGAAIPSVRFAAVEVPVGRIACELSYPLAMTFALGFDGGGTKTECVLVDESGAVASRSLTGASNPLRIGFDRAYSSLTTAATATLAAARLHSSDIAAVCAGMAGAGRSGVSERLSAFFRENFAKSFVHVTSDLEVALEAAAGPAPGVILIAGTGSSTYGRNAHGETARAGGYGPWIGDEGSAYDIGRRAIAAMLHFRDCGLQVPVLGEKVLAAVGSPGWDDLIELTAADPDNVFPRMFPVIVEAADGGDTVAREILSTSAKNLAGIVSTLIRRLKIENESFPLAKTGGVFAHSTLLNSEIDQLLHTIAPEAKISVLELSPAVGAARLALRLAAGRGSSGYADAG